MEQNYHRTGLVNWLTLLVVAGLSAILARYAESAGGWVAAMVLTAGFLSALISYFQSRLISREASERLEYEELKKSKGAASLFAEADALPAGRTLEQFERFFVPGFTIVLVLLQATAAWMTWKWVSTAPTPSVERATISMALYALFALVLFMTGKYSSGLARLKGQHLLRPGASYLLLGSVICATVAVGEAVAWFGFDRVDGIIARVLAIFLALVALELLAALVLEIYRPRVKGRVTRLLYESRLVGLLGQPGGLITTAAHALDYQFGFKVSETWFYRFLEKALAWIILLQLAVLFLSTMVVIIEPNEQGLLERWGRPVENRAVLEPGFHLKWPWPIDQVYRYATRRVQGFVVGVVPDDDLEQQTTILWTQPHYKEEFNLLVASGQSVGSERTAVGDNPVPANLVVVSIPVQYQITNLVDWAYQHADATNLLEQIANREVVRYLVGEDFEDLMSSGRLEAAGHLRREIQNRANELRLGVDVLFVGLQGIHPPVGDKTSPVVAAFEEVVGAMHQKQTNILAAQAYALGRLPLAQAEATNLLVEAQSVRARKVEVAAAEEAQFASQIGAFEASPRVYRDYTYLNALTRAIKPARKYVVAATNTSDVVILNLEEDLPDDLLNTLVLPDQTTTPPSAAE